MLVLSRKRDEVVCIGEAVRVMVTEVLDNHGHPVRGGKVLLGIEAPKSMRIDREEITKLENYNANKEKYQVEPGNVPNPDYGGGRI